MQDPTSDNAELSKLAAQLAALAPRATLDRDRLMFIAGQRTAARRLRATRRWLAATSAVCGGVIAVLVALLSRPSESLPGRAKVIEARNLVKAEHVQSDPRSRDAARTREDGSTNFRLLRLLGCDVKTGLAARLESVPPMEVDAVAPPSYPRALLNYYLEHGQGRL